MGYFTTTWYGLIMFDLRSIIHQKYEFRSGKVVPYFDIIATSPTGTEYVVGKMSTMNITIDLTQYPYKSNTEQMLRANLYTIGVFAPLTHETSKYLGDIISTHCIGEKNV